MPPYTRHNEITILGSWPGNIDANYFNQAQTALKRLEKQIRFKIPNLNHLDLILQDDAWVVVDRVLNDMPVAAWTDFQTEGRDNLHAPIACEVRIYHFAARAIIERTLEAMEDILRQSLVERYQEDGATVLPIKEDA